MTEESGSIPPRHYPQNGVKSRSLSAKQRGSHFTHDSVKITSIFPMRCRNQAAPLTQYHIIIKSRQENLYIGWFIDKGSLFFETIEKI